MSTYWPGSMRGLRAVKTPLLLLLLLLLSAQTGTVLCENEDNAPDPEDPETTTQAVTDDSPLEYGDSPDSAINDPDASSTSEVATDGSGSDVPSTSPPQQESSSTITPSVSDQAPMDETPSPVIILIPVVLVVVIIGMIVCGIFINRRLNNTRNQELKKEDPYLDGPSTEKVPMPMFEEDVPSVLELEMEELDQWMKKDGKSTEDSAQA